MDGEPRRECSYLLHVDHLGVVHRVYRKPTLLRPVCWPANTSVEGGLTACGIDVDVLNHSEEGGHVTCMACAVVTEADLLRLDVLAIKDDYNHACVTIADMHAAATGRVGGSIRGVVEDVQDLRAERDCLKDLLSEAHKRCEGLEGRCRALEAELEELRGRLLAT